MITINIHLVDMAVKNNMNKLYYEIFLNPFIMRLLRYIKKSTINILCYHSIAYEISPFIKGGQVTPPDVFEDQVKYLKNNYNLMSFDELSWAFAKQQSLERAVVITFDDGYRNVFSNAIPILEKYSVPATIFLITDLIDNKKLFWRNKIRYLINIGGREKLLAFMKDKISDPKRLNINSWISDPSVLFAYKELVDEYFKLIGLNEYELAQKEQLYFNNADIQKVDPNLITFGNHTLSHPVLSCLSAEEQKKEIINSYRFLKEKFPERDIYFAYPFGNGASFNEEAKKIVSESGHKGGVTLLGRGNNSDMFSLGRKLVPAVAGRKFEAFMCDVTLSSFFGKLVRR